MKILREVEDRSVDILVGTQMVTKGHDFSGITLVGVVSADDSLNIPDFRASEKTFQLLTQVAGRSGRGNLPGHVFLQTYHPGHHSIEASREHDFLRFYREEMVFRKVAEYPPYFRLVLFLIEGANEKRVQSFAGQVKNLVDSMGLEEKRIRVVGPAPAFVYKVKNRYRWRILLKGKEVGFLHRWADQILDTVESDPRFKKSGIRFMADADPIHLL
jgi:primosomal protein N' (replication factor Y)